MEFPKEVITERVAIDPVALRKAMEFDRALFINVFLAEELTLPVPDIHVELFETMVSAEVMKLALAVPRGHAKTTIAKLVVVHQLLYSASTRFVLYMSSNARNAINACIDIVKHFKSDAFAAIYGPPEFEIDRDNDGTYKFSITDGHGRTKLCILKAMGAGQSVRGMNIDNRRPELVIADDIEDINEVRTVEALEKTKKWFYTSFYKALSPRHSRLIHIGNMISSKCLLAIHCASPLWHSILYGVLRKNGQPLWPEMFPLEAIAADFAEYARLGQLGDWFAEMMNMPQAGAKSLVQMDKVRFAPVRVPGEEDAACITIDLAISDQTWAHATVVACHALVEGQWQLVEWREEYGIDPITLFDQVVYPMAVKWRAKSIGIEGVAYQKALKHVFAFLVQSKPVRDLNFVDLPARAAKSTRIAVWAGMVNNGEYVFTDGDMAPIWQLADYDPKKKENEDDVIDACAHFATMLREYLPIMLERLEMPHLVSGVGVLTLEQISSV